GTDRGADLPHGLLNGVKKGTTGVLHEVPAVGNLDNVRECFGGSQGVAAATVAGDHGDLRLAAEPSLRCSRFSIRQQSNGLASFQVANNRSVALVSAPRPVVASHDGRRRKTPATALTHYTKKSVVADLKHQSPSETRGRAATKSKPEVVDDIIEPASAPRPRRQNIILEAFGEDDPAA